MDLDMKNEILMSQIVIQRSIQYLKCLMTLQIIQLNQKIFLNFIPKILWKKGETCPKILL